LNIIFRHGRKYAIRDQNSFYFVTFTIINWIDLFIRNEYREILVNSLNYCHGNKGLNIHAYCIMTSHLHLILSANEGYSLSDIIRDFKRHTSSTLRSCIIDNPSESRKDWFIWFFERAGKKNKRNKDFQLWQQHNHPIELSTKPMDEQRLEYIHYNPVVAGFVNDPTAWEWSSCASYKKSIDDKVELIYL